MNSCTLIFNIACRVGAPLVSQYARSQCITSKVCTIPAVSQCARNTGNANLT